MAENRYEGIIFPQYYEDVFTEGDLDFRFRLIRTHIHPKLRDLITGCLDVVGDLFETDPYTFSKLFREPRTCDGDSERMRCALYGLKPVAEVFKAEVTNVIRLTDATGAVVARLRIPTPREPDLVPLRHRDSRFCGDSLAGGARRPLGDDESSICAARSGCGGTQNA